MKAYDVRRGGLKGALIALLLAVLLSAPRPALAADTLDVVVDQAKLMKLPEKVATIVVGNPLIADISLQTGGIVVITGKGYGTTNLVALDRLGKVLLEEQVLVRGRDDTLVMYQGPDRQSYSCTPNCERRITLGDSADYFTAIQTQAETRNGAAASGGAAAAKAPAR